MKLKTLLYTIATYVPGVNRFYVRETGGTNSARYCYSVWLRHLVHAKNNGLTPHPNTVAELGPGDSLGIGIAALLSGCEKYIAFDIIERVNPGLNLLILEELLALFKNKAPIPCDDEFPNLKPNLDTYAFPADILNDSRLLRALEESRVKKISDALKNPSLDDSLIQYKAPWHHANLLENESVDMIYSQAVLEHIDDLQNTYESMNLWLKPAGYMSHQIDFKCHGTASEWNGHWKYSDFVWKLITGRRPYLLNREPHSTHVSLLKQEGFRIIYDGQYRTKSTLANHQLAMKFKSISEDDLTTSGAFIQAKKIVKISCQT